MSGNGQEPRQSLLPGGISNTVFHGLAHKEAAPDQSRDREGAVADQPYDCEGTSGANRRGVRFFDVLVRER